jgi:hypothetical protein
MRASPALIALAAILTATSAQVAARQEPATVAGLLDSYARGNDRAFQAPTDHPETADHLFPTFGKVATKWVSAAGPAERERRTLVAATAALELAHALRRAAPEHGARYLVWATLLVRKNAPRVPTPAERLWYLASLAGMQELGRDGWALIATEWSSPTSTEMMHLRSALGADGALASALRRTPDEPRLLLAKVEAAELEKTESAIYFSEITAALQTDLRRQAAARVPDAPQNAEQANAVTERNWAIKNLAQFERIPEIEDQYETLNRFESLRAEIELRIGYLEFRLGSWTGALDHLSRATSLTTDTYLLYLAQFITGRTYQRADNPPASLAAFARAAAIIPDARAATIEWAAELYVSELAANRNRAAETARIAYSDGAADDPWRLYFQGDARLWSAYMAQLRSALR